MRIIIILLLLMEAQLCFGAAVPFPEREIEVQLGSIQLVEATKANQSQTTATPADTAQFAAFLKAGTDRIASGMPSASLKFNFEEHRFVKETDPERLNPKTEQDLDELFNLLYVGAPYKWVFRTLPVHFVPSLPSPSVLTSGKYKGGSHEGVRWVSLKEAWRHEVAFAFTAGDPTPQQFAEAFRQCFLQLHDMGIGTSDQASSALRTALLAPNGIGHFDPHQAARHNATHFYMDVSDVIVGRCYKLLKWNGTEKKWDELWFKTYTSSSAIPQTFGFQIVERSALYHFIQCPDRL